MVFSGENARREILYEEMHPYGSSAYRSAPSAVDVSARRYRYTGKERDEETGLDYFGARYYAPWLGRWTSADPLGLQAGLNLYLYGRASPLRFVDPSGTQDVDLTGIGESLSPAAGGVLAERRQRREEAAQAGPGEEATHFLRYASQGFRLAPRGEASKVRLNSPENAAIDERLAEAGQQKDWAEVDLEAVDEKGRPLWGTYRGAPVQQGYIEPSIGGIIPIRTSDVEVWLSVGGIFRIGAVVVGEAASTLQGLRALSTVGDDVAVGAEATLGGVGKGGAVAAEAATFGADDVAFGLARAGGRPGVLAEFAGDAIPGTRAPLSPATSSLAPGPSKNAAIAQDTLKFAKESLEQSGGRLRFNLEGFNTAEALKPGGANYSSVTSAEFRGILKDEFLRSRTHFYRNGVDVTEQILKAAGYK